MHLDDALLKSYASFLMVNDFYCLEIDDFHEIVDDALHRVIADWMRTILIAHPIGDEFFMDNKYKMLHVLSLF